MKLAVTSLESLGGCSLGTVLRSCRMDVRTSSGTRFMKLMESAQIGHIALLPSQVPGAATAPHSTNYPSPLTNRSEVREPLQQNPLRIARDR
jgi:hypothetical protein